MRSVRVKVLAALASALAVGLFAIAPAVGSAAADEVSPEGGSPGASPALEAVPLDESCPQGYVCVWNESEYKGERGLSLCSNTGVHELNGYKFSIKNRCASQSVTTSDTWVVCVNAQNNAETLPFLRIRINEGNSCP